MPNTSNPVCTQYWYGVRKKRELTYQPVLSMKNTWNNLAIKLQRTACQIFKPRARSEEVACQPKVVRKTQLQRPIKSRSFHILRAIRPQLLAVSLEGMRWKIVVKYDILGGNGTRSLLAHRFDSELEISDSCGSSTAFWIRTRSDFSPKSLDILSFKMPPSDCTPVARIEKVVSRVKDEDSAIQTQNNLKNSWKTSLRY